MKYLLVLVVVLGFACGSEEEDLGLQRLVEIDDDTDSSLEEEGRQAATIDPALIIGNVISALNNLNISDPNSIINDILKALSITGGTAATVGGLGAIGGVKSVFDGLVSFILGLISMPIAIANMILSLVGLVVLIIFLIDGGDFGSLLGVARSMNDWGLSDILTLDPMNSPVVDFVSKAFFAVVDVFGNL